MVWKSLALTASTERAEFEIQWPFTTEKGTRKLSDHNSKPNGEFSTRKEEEKR